MQDKEYKKAVLNSLCLPLTTHTTDSPIEHFLEEQGLKRNCLLTSPNSPVPLLISGDYLICPFNDSQPKEPLVKYFWGLLLKKGTVFSNL